MQKDLAAVFSPQLFEPFPGVQGVAQFEERWTKNRNWVLSNLAHLAYFDEAGIKARLEPFGASVEFFDNDGAQAFLARWQERAVLAFRGSQPREREPNAMTSFFRRAFTRLRRFSNGVKRLGIDWEMIGFLGNDVLADLRFRLVPFPGSDATRVHEGFLEEIDKLWNGIEPKLAEVGEGVQMWATGHSLGAAMATLAGMRRLFAEVVTFGEPRVGHQLGLAFKGDVHVRFVNGDDPVTKLPPEVFFDYEHHGDPVEIQNADGKTDFKYDHSIVYYSANLA